MPYALVTLLPGPRFADRPRVAPDHVRFIEGLMARHALLCGGPFTAVGPEFGAYVLRCQDVAAAEATAAEDPYVRAGVCEARVREWSLVAVDPAAAEPGMRERDTRARTAYHAAVLGHLSLGAADLARAAAFYDAVLAPLGYVRVWTTPDAVGYGSPGGGDKLAINAVGRQAAALGDGFHLAFAAPDARAVDAFHAAALASGGQDDGPPGLRPRYGPGYYAAFVVDPDGHALEAVWHGRRA